MAKGSLQTAKSETGFQSFVLVICLWEMNPDLDENSLRQLEEFNLHKSTRELALDFNTSQLTICHHLDKLGKVSKRGVWLLHTLIEKNTEDHIIHSKKFSFKTEKWAFLKIGDKKLGLLWQCSMEKAVNWQGWIFIAYSKGRASWKKSYAVCIARSLQYYSFGVFTLQSAIQCRLIKSFIKKTPYTCQ